MNKKKKVWDVVPPRDWFEKWTAFNNVIQLAAKTRNHKKIKVN